MPLDEMVLVFLHPAGVHGKGRERLGRARDSKGLQRWLPAERARLLARRASSSSTRCTTSRWSTTTPTCTHGGARPWAGASRSPPCCVCPSTSWAASSRPRGPWLRSVPCAPSPAHHPSLPLGVDMTSRAPCPFSHPPAGTDPLCPEPLGQLGGGCTGGELALQGLARVVAAEERPVPSLHSSSHPALH